MNKYGECQMYIYYIDSEGCMIKYHKQNKTYQKFTDSINENGIVTGSYWELVHI